MTRCSNFLIMISCAALMTSTVWAIDAEPELENPTLQARYRLLINEIRCLVCQNQSIADSNAPLAADLRREVREMITEGSTDKEITTFLVARYGDFVLYRPPFNARTWVLWGTPLLFLGIGFLVFTRILRVRGNQPIDEGEGM